MPLYRFVCDGCGAERNVTARMEDVPGALVSFVCEACEACGGRYNRRFTPPQLISDPILARPENQPFLGMSDREALAQMKADDVDYERGYSQVGEGLANDRGDDGPD